MFVEFADFFVEFVFDEAKYHDVAWWLVFFENIAEVELAWAVDPAAECADREELHRVVVVRCLL